MISSKRKKEIDQLQRKANMTMNIAENTLTNQKDSEPKILKTEEKIRHINSEEQENNRKTTENLITNLKIISNIKENEKIYMNEKNIIEIDKSYCPSISRYLYERSRQETISFLKQIVDDILHTTDAILSNEHYEIDTNTNDNINLLSKDFTEYNSDILQKFILEINKSYTGLDNLTKTYKQDITIVSEIQVIKEKLQIRCVKINNVLTIKKNN